MSTTSQEARSTSIKRDNTTSSSGPIPKCFATPARSSAQRMAALEKRWSIRLFAALSVRSDPTASLSVRPLPFLRHADPACSRGPRCTPLIGGVSVILRLKMRHLVLGNFAIPGHDDSFIYLYVAMIDWLSNEGRATG
jgi:hypothetical protein